MKKFVAILLAATILMSLVPFSFVSVTAEATTTVDANGTKVVYIPLDDRPVNKERVEYLAAASGFEIIMPETELYQTVLDPDYIGISDQGNPEELFQWLKSVDEDVKYFVISLDQLFSGGLVGSRAPFGDTDDTITNTINSDGSYTLSEKEQEIVDYLIQLSNREDTHVVYFDTVMRLASTGNYFDYRGNDYSNFRLFGIMEREQFTGESLTISNIVANYNKDKNGNTIAVELTSANQGNWNIVYGETALGSMVFTDDIYNTDRGLDAAEYREYFAARERKLRIAEALYPNITESVDRLYIGVDDSNPKTTIQTNECRFITEKLINGYDQCALFAGADELGLMGIADVATSIYGEVGVNLQYFGNGKDSAADEYDKGTLDETVKTHILSVGADYNSANPKMDILVLTRTDGGDEYNTAELTELDNQIAGLVAKAEANQAADIPTCIIDASCKKGRLSKALLNSNVDIALLMGYSEWNTVSNALGIGISNAVARYAYIFGEEASDVLSEDYFRYSNAGFLKSSAFGWVKEFAYQNRNGHPFPSQSDFQSNYNGFFTDAKMIADKINSGYMYVGIDENGNLIKENRYDISISNLNWPWDRSFECNFDIGIYDNGKAPATVGNVSNLAYQKKYETSQLYQQGGAADNWGWSDSAPVTYPDENGTSLTDGVYAAADAKYSDVTWAGFNGMCPQYTELGYSYITIDLGKAYDVYNATLYVGSSYLGGGISTPKTVQMYVSQNGVDFEKVGETVPVDNSASACQAVTVYSKYKYTTARYVQLRMTRGGYMFVCEAEVMGVEASPEVRDLEKPNPDKYATFETMETIVVDGYLDDSGWDIDGWIEVTPETGFWQATPSVDTLSYAYQLRTDDTKLYGAVLANCDLVVGGNGTGTNLRFWINTNENASVYTHFYDVNATSCLAKYNTSTTANSAANIENTTLNGVTVGGTGVSYFEFSIDLAEFGGENGFGYYLAFSNRINENICLYHPVVPGDSGSANNLPYKAWSFSTQGAGDVEALKLTELPHEHMPEEDWTYDENNHWKECQCGEDMDLAPHISGEWIVIDEATVEKDGLQKKYCIICGCEVDSEAIPQLPMPEPEPEPEPEPDPEPTVMKGDLNGNGEIDSIDYSLLKRAYFATFIIEDISVADINGNGEIDSIDYSLLKRAYFDKYIIQ